MPHKPHTVYRKVPTNMFLMVLRVIENVEDEFSRLLALSILVRFDRLCLEVRVDSLPQSTKPFSTTYQCDSFASREKFIGGNHRRAICKCTTLSFHYFGCCLRTRNQKRAKNYWHWGRINVKFWLTSTPAMTIAISPPWLSVMTGPYSLAQLMNVEPMLEHSQLVKWIVKC